MTIFTIAKRSVAGFLDDKVMRLSSSIAFAAIFSIAPLFIVLIAILGAVVGGHAAAQERLLAAVRSGAGDAAAETIKQIVATSFNRPRQGLVAQLVGWAVFLIGASNLFAALQDALNSIWGVEQTKGGWRQIARDRIASGGMIVIIACILIATFIANAAVVFITTRLTGFLPSVASAWTLNVAVQALTFFVVLLVFTLVLKVLPDVKLGMRDAAFGGFVTTVLFTIGQTLIGIYFTKGGVTSAYGAAGSLLVALLWIYYSVTIILFGAEVTKVIATRAELTAPSAIRRTSDRPAGSDPRETPRSA